MRILSRLQWTTKNSCFFLENSLLLLWQINDSTKLVNINWNSTNSIDFARIIEYHTHFTQTFLPIPLRRECVGSGPQSLQRCTILIVDRPTTEARTAAVRKKGKTEQTRHACRWQTCLRQTYTVIRLANGLYSFTRRWCVIEIVCLLRSKCMNMGILIHFSW